MNVTLNLDLSSPVAEPSPPVKWVGPRVDALLNENTGAFNASFFWVPWAPCETIGYSRRRDCSSLADSSKAKRRMFLRQQDDRRGTALALDEQRIRPRMPVHNLTHQSEGSRSR